MKQYDYDLIVVGSGIGLTVLNEGLNQDLNCALIENGKMGGTCLTRGCIPSKVLTYAADMVRSAQHAKNIGIDFRIEAIDWDRIASRMWSQIDESKDIDASLMKVDQLALYRGMGEFTGTNTLRVKKRDGSYSREFTGKSIVLASGARSLIPRISGIEEAGYVTTESFFGEKFPARPWKSVIMVGGGIIAAEFAHVFSAFGTAVTVVEMSPRILSSEDEDISKFVESNFRKKMTVLTNRRAEAARAEGGRKYLTVVDTKTGKSEELTAEEIFICAGRTSNADLLKVEKSNIETFGSERWIRTNPYLETNIPDIWAAGDANGLYQFRHKANADANTCIRNLFGKRGAKEPVDYAAVPWAVFTDPQVGHVGMTEKEAIDRGLGIYRSIKRYSSVAKGFAMGYLENDQDDGFVKLVLDDSMRIIGAHVAGPHAAMLVQPFVYLMNAGYTCSMVKPSKNRRAHYDTEFDHAMETGTKLDFACPGAGTILPIYNSMVIHPSLNEVTGWALSGIEPVNIP